MLAHAYLVLAVGIVATFVVLAFATFVALRRVHTPHPWLTAA